MTKPVDLQPGTLAAVVHAMSALHSKPEPICAADLQADCDHQFRADRIDPYAVVCVKCGKFHRFPPVKRSDRDDYDAACDQAGLEY